jgi:hypothetical protein
MVNNSTNINKTIVFIPDRGKEPRDQMDNGWEPDESSLATRWIEVIIIYFLPSTNSHMLFLTFYDIIT